VLVSCAGPLSFRMSLLMTRATNPIVDSCMSFSSSSIGDKAATLSKITRSYCSLLTVSRSISHTSSAKWPEKREN